MITDGKIDIKESDDTPMVLFDAAENILKFSGPSFPENAPDFYNPIIAEVCKIDPNSPGKLIIELDFSILSSASNKLVYEMLVKLEKLMFLGKEMLVKWYYEGFDEDMEDEGNGYKSNLQINFELCEK
ncbi:MAG: DUF1987 domain-containing protein [Bacteroidales bacterium]|jgi:hypothetical protein|nr:DUF1987 domain-containing protein [Bacteroidales bacterium]